MPTRRAAYGAPGRSFYLMFVLWCMHATVVVDATTLASELIDTYGSCYDPAGVACSCTGSFFFA